MRKRKRHGSYKFTEKTHSKRGIVATVLALALLVLLLLGILIFFQILPFFSGILGAMTIYILLRNQMLYLTEKKRMKRSIMAILSVMRDDSLFSYSPVDCRVGVREQVAGHKPGPA